MVFSKFLGERPSGGDKYSGTFRTESIGYLSWYFDFRKIILSNSCESLKMSKNMFSVFSLA